MKQTPYNKDRNNKFFEVLAFGMRAFGAQINTEIDIIPFSGQAGDFTVVLQQHHSVWAKVQQNSANANAASTESANMTTVWQSWC